MELKTVKYNYVNIDIDNSQAQTNFKKEISVKHIIYFFYKDDICLYIGETGAYLKDRCYTHTPKHSKKTWFKEANIIYIIQLDECIDNIARQAIEASFILAYRPKYNKKA